MRERPNPSDINSQIAHSIPSDPATDELVDVLRRHFAQEINGMLSIDANKAAAATGLVFANLLIHFDEREIREICNVVAESSIAKRREAIRQHKISGEA